jgi:hypothetical protein
MTYSDLFTIIKTTNYNESGTDVDWTIFVDDASKRTYLLFKCSDSSYDWRVNFDFPCIMYKNKLMRVHRGFAKSYKSAKDEVMKAYIDTVEKHPGYKNIIAGWSYGGAMATLASEDFNYRTRTDKSVVNSGMKATLITYGAPKIMGSFKGAAYVRTTVNMEDSKQFANTFDIVTKLVPVLWYRHICKLTKLEKFIVVNFWRIFRPGKYEHTYYDEIIRKNDKDGLI